MYKTKSVIKLQPTIHNSWLSQQLSIIMLLKHTHIIPYEEYRLWVCFQLHIEPATTENIEATITWNWHFTLDC